jgi:hypothetical protein
MSDTRIEFYRALGRRTRLGNWQDQKISTYRKIREAVAQGSWDHAADLADYFVDEADCCFSIYRQWIPDLNGFLAKKGLDADELKAVNAKILAKLDLPDGTPYEAYEQWERFRAAVRVLIKHLHREEPDAALAALDEACEEWRRCHDRDVDHSYGLMDEVVQRFGEAALGEMWDHVIIPLFSWRYEKFDIDKHPWDEGLETLMLVACEAMRGHLVGPERRGDFELIETDDRFILRFDPCGSGGRTIRGDIIEGTPPRMEEPYNWAVSKEPHPWNHFQTGICHYCTHCIELMEMVPIDRFGYPVRVIDPPRYPDTHDPATRQYCQWQMFKDPTQVPEEYYERSGRTKPKAFGSIAQNAPELPRVTNMPGAG